MVRPLVWLALVACTPGARVAFEATDPQFRAMPGPEPRVYFESELDHLPRGELRSVGVISVVSNGNLEHAGRLAAAKGRELGCAMVIEYAAFARMGTRAVIGDGFVVTLAHGPPHAPAHRTPANRRVRFHCVVRDDPRSDAI